MRVLEFDGGRETIVFLHGGNVAGWMWGQQVPSFGDYRVIVPDLPGFGESRGEEWVSIADTADRVAEILDGPTHVVGLSLGSSIAIELAVRHPALVRSLFLASAQVAPPRRRDRVVGRFMLTLWERRGFWTSLARSYGLADSDAELFIETGLGIRRATADAIFEEVSRGIPREVLELVEAPTLAVAGERDSRSVNRTSLELVSRGIPGSLTAIAPGMHHQWNIEDVELFTSALRTWLASGGIDTGLVARRG